MSGKLHHLDTRGHVCPIPVLLAVREMLVLSPGDVLELVGDDPGVAQDIPAWAQMNGHRVLAVEQKGDLVTCRVEKTETGDPLTRGPVEEAFFDDPPDGAESGSGA